MVEKHKVAIIAGQLVVGGAERQLYLWLAHMDREIFDPLVITLHPNHDDYWEKPIEDLGIPLLRVTQKTNRFTRLSEIIRLVRPFKPDLIHGWHFFASAYAGMAARFLGVPCVGGIRSGYSANQRDLETFLVHNYCDAVVANSKAATEAYRFSLGKRKQPVFTVANAIVNSFASRETIREELSVRYDLPVDALWICSIGRMDPLKRFDLLLEMTRRLATSHKDFYLVLIGDGPEKAGLESLSNSFGISDRVRFLGEVPNASNWMKGMDIFCFPSTSEGLPNVIMEAAAAGLPVVAWKLPFIEELLPDKSMASLSTPGDLASMVSNLAELLNSLSLRKSIGMAAQQHILETFGVERYVREMTSVYTSVLKVSTRSQ
ncbi:MAG: glycosyltransferase [Anaerolineaceae bacterium]